MAITFLIGENLATAPRGRFVVLDKEIHAYLAQMERRLGFPIASIADLDPYSVKVIRDDDLRQLEEQAAESLMKFEAIFATTPFPVDLEPPAQVGLEADPFGTACGKTGVLNFLREILDISREAEEHGLPLLAAGD